MHEAIEVTSTFLDLLSHVIVNFHIEYVRDQVQCILIVLHFGVQAGKIESIRQVILIDLAKVLIAT